MIHSILSSVSVYWTGTFVIFTKEKVEETSGYGDQSTPQIVINPPGQAATPTFESELEQRMRDVNLEDSSPPNESVKEERGAGGE